MLQQGCTIYFTSAICPEPQGLCEYVWCPCAEWYRHFSITITYLIYRWLVEKELNFFTSIINKTCCGVENICLITDLVVLYPNFVFSADVPVWISQTCYTVSIFHVCDYAHKYITRTNLPLRYLQSNERQSHQKLVKNINFVFHHLIITYTLMLACVTMFNKHYFLPN